MAKACGRAKSGFWWVIGFVCALFFRPSPAPAQMSDKYGVPERPVPGAGKPLPGVDMPVPPGTVPVPVPFPPPLERRTREFPGTNPNDRADAERLLSRLSEPVKAVEPTSKERDDSRKLLSKLLKSAGDSEAHAKAGRTEEAQKSNRERLDAFRNLVKLGPSALGILRDRKSEMEKEGKASAFVRSQVSQSIRRIEADARAGMEEKIGRLGQGALSALPSFERKAADEAREAGDRVESLERAVGSAEGGERERLRRELFGARETLADAQDRQALLRSIRAKAATEAAKAPSPPFHRDPFDGGMSPEYGVMARPRYGI